MFAMATNASGTDVLRESGAGKVLRESGAGKLPHGAPTPKKGEFPAAAALLALGPSAAKGTVLITWPMGVAEYVYRVDRDGDKAHVSLADGVTVEQFKALWSQVTDGDVLTGEARSHDTTAMLPLEEDLERGLAAEG